MKSRFHGIRIPWTWTVFEIQLD